MRIRFDRFPGGLTKAVSFSFDDGRDHDRRLVAIMNRYGLKGTFHLNSGFFGHDGYITAAEVADLYRGHEVSAHTVDHPFLEQSPTEQVAEEVLADRAALESLAGYPVKGMSYPFGTYDDKVVAVLAAIGVEYSRTVRSHGEFHLPSHPLEWHPSCHQKDVLVTGERFLESQPWKSRMELLLVWGHSFEFANNDNWELMEQAGELLGGKPNLWYTTMAEVVAYRQALERLRFSVDRTIVHNPTALDLWFSAEDDVVKVSAGETLRL